MLMKLRKRLGREEGFTLIELLVVIVILAVLAAVVVFAVNGISDRGQQSACETDRETIQHAEEAYSAKRVDGNGAPDPGYTDMDGLRLDGLLSITAAEAATPEYNDVTAFSDNGYTITPQGACSALIDPVTVGTP